MERDVRAEVQYIGRQLAREASDVAMLHDGANVAEIVPDIFTACGNAVQMWLEAQPPIPNEPHVVYPDIPLIALPATQPDVAASEEESKAESGSVPNVKEKPHWDKDTRSLLYNGSVVKRFRQPAPKSNRCTRRI